MILKLQKLKRLLAFSMAVSMVTPTTAFAMETPTEVVEEQGVVETPVEPESEVESSEPEVTVPETPVEPEAPVVPETPEEPEKPVVPETPEEPETPEVPETPDKPVEPEVVAPDKKLLEEAITKAEAEVKLTDKYMEDSIKALQTVITEAKTLNSKEDATQSDVDAMVEKVNKALAEMKLKEEPATPDEEQKPEEGQKPEEEQKPEAEVPEEKPESQPVVTPPINTVVPMPDLSYTDDFRFWVIAKDYAFAKEDLNIIEDTKDDARVIGTLPKDGLCYVIKECDEKEKTGWVFVESGTVRGFVKADAILHGDEAITKVDSLKKQVEEQVNKENEELKAKITKEVAEEFKEAKKAEEKKSSKKDEDTITTVDVVEDTEKPLTEEETVNQRYEAEKKEVPSFETICTFATEVVNWKDNLANDYTRATTQNVLIAKDYALVTASTLNVREGKGTDTRIVAQLPNNALVYQIADVGDEWVYIESGDVRGFVHSSWVKDDEGVDEEVAKTGEDNFPKVNEMISYEDNKATHYTMTSVKSGFHTSAKRKEVLEFASQFIGNPYVWGGNDPHTGADCSGFVKYVYNAFGYKDIPRVAADQAYYGEQIPVSQAQPGDLIFYRNASGHIYHVVMYAGDGMTVEAANQRKGICNSKVYSDACWAVRILDDDVMSEQEEIVKIAEDGSYGKYLGNFKLTYYCPNSCCCGEYANGKTATGTQTVQGRTIAVDPSVIPYGSEVIIGNRVYVAEDCGGAIKGNRIDIFMNNHEDATNMGVGYADVYLKK